MFNRVAEKIRTAKTTEEKKKWLECCYAVLEYGGARDDAYRFARVYLDFDEAEALFKKELDEVNEKIEAGTYNDVFDAYENSLSKIKYYYCYL